MKKPTKSLAVCVKNKGYTASLELRKIYVVLADADAEQLGHVRVVDESGEDYLYPTSMFVAVDLPQTVRRAIARAA